MFAKTRPRAHDRAASCGRIDSRAGGVHRRTQGCSTRSNHIVVSKRDERVVKKTLSIDARYVAISAFCAIQPTKWLDVDVCADRSRESRFMSL